MKKIILGILLASTSSISFAEDIAYEKECPDGGSRQVSGSYDSASGDFKLVTEIIECARYDEISNGTHIAEGNFLVANSIFEPMANIEAVIISDISVTHKEETINFSCTKNINGSYDMTTNTLDGEIKSDCTHNGKVTIPILELLSGDEIDEEMDNSTEENKNNGEYPYPDGNDIKDQIDQCVNSNQGNPDWNPNGNTDPWDQGNQNGHPGGPNNQGENPWDQGNHNANGPNNNSQNPWGEEDKWDENEWDDNEWDENEDEKDESDPSNVVLPVTNPIS